jgi:heat shock protein HslJ
MKYFVRNLLTGCFLIGIIACSSSDKQDDSIVIHNDWNHIGSYSWKAISIEGKPLLEGTKATIQFQFDGKVVGNGGVNRYFAKYKRTEPNQLQISAVGSTQMYMDNPVGLMVQESQFLQLIPQANRYRINNNTLELLTDDTVILTFEKENQ